MQLAQDPVVNARGVQERRVVSAVHEAVAYSCHVIMRV
jgi:hypothetical protein